MIWLVLVLHSQVSSWASAQLSKSYFIGLISICCSAGEATAINLHTHHPNMKEYMRCGQRCLLLRPSLLYMVMNPTFASLASPVPLLQTMTATQRIWQVA